MGEEIRIDEKGLKRHTLPPRDSETIQKDIWELFQFQKLRANPFPKHASIADQVSYTHNVCNNSSDIHQYQAIVGQFINPETRYSELLVFHGLGTGKTFAAITSAESFRDQVTKYHSRITVVVPGRRLKENWYRELIKSYGVDSLQDAEEKMARKEIKELYNIMTYEQFGKLVVGDRVVTDSKEVLYRPVPNAIEALNHSILIVDEAHNLVTSNQDSDKRVAASIEKLVRDSKNLKVLFLSATPIRNIGTDIVRLMNLLIPKKDRQPVSAIFAQKESVADIEFTPLGQELLKDMVRGRVSYFESADPVLFPRTRYDGVDIGVTHGVGLKLISCKMSKASIQYQAYARKILPLMDVKNFKIQSINVLQRAQAVSNFCYPVLSDDGLRETSGIADLDQYRVQWMTNRRRFEKLVRKKYGIKTLGYSSTTRLPRGEMLRVEHLEKLSTKFYHLLRWLQKNPGGPCFVYSGLVVMGVDVLEEVFKENGYHDFRDKTQRPLAYDICSVCNKRRSVATHSDHGGFMYSYFVSFKGSGSTDSDSSDTNALKAFNHRSNADGSKIQIVLASQVLSEGVTLKNLRSIHIMDAWLNMSRIQQIIGRGVRWCSHDAVTTVENPRPEVLVRIYCADTPDRKHVSAERLVYGYALRKMEMNRSIEQTLKEEAVDCPLNFHANKVKCSGSALNKEYWNGATKSYTPPHKLNKTTYTDKLVEKDLRQHIKKIQSLYLRKSIYAASEIVEAFPECDSSTIHRALELLTPATQHLQSQFDYSITNQFGKKGYLLFRSEFYIFQPWSATEEEPFMVRRQFQTPGVTTLSLSEFYTNEGAEPALDKKKKKLPRKNKAVFDSVYLNGSVPENPNLVGIWSQNKHGERVFKVREAMKSSKMGRGKNIATFEGNECRTKPLTWLKTQAAKEKIAFPTDVSRKDICAIIADSMKKRQRKDKRTTYLIDYKTP